MGRIVLWTELCALIAPFYSKESLIKLLSTRPRNGVYRPLGGGSISMRQATLASAGFERYSKTTRRVAFLAEMEQVVPWQMLCGLIEPVYPKPATAGRRSA